MVADTTVPGGDDRGRDGGGAPTPVVPVTCVLAGGGTAGHVMPAIAVADALVAAGVRREAVVFAGAESGQERTLVPAAGYPLEVLEVANFPREGIGRILRTWPRSALAQVRAVRAALAALSAWRAGCVVSLGGYASVPWVLAARRLRRPVLVISYDAIPGRASRMQGRMASARALAFPPPAGGRRPAGPVGVVTGAPVRSGIVALGGMDDTARAAARSAARAELGLPEGRRVILAFGGSLGSGRINDAVDAWVRASADRGDLAVRHVVGRRNAAGPRPGATWLPSAPPGADPPGEIIYQQLDFDDRMALAYAAADLAVTRAGAMTVAELAAAGVASVLVPWPQAADDHQRANAAVLVDAGGAVLLDDADCTPERLGLTIDACLVDGRGEAMAAAARTVGRHDAAEKIAAMILDLASRGPVA
jgi:UDP-N-acetylglucosamine--N-acetylmuramyl-(pentapeptide) pyrophosphoryl-undecaprenol N-acetylglucosamine transferase